MSVRSFEWFSYAQLLPRENSRLRSLGTQAFSTYPNSVPGDTSSGWCTIGDFEIMKKSHLILQAESPVTADTSA